MAENKWEVPAFSGEDRVDLLSPSRFWEGLNPGASFRLQSELAVIAANMEAYPWNDTAIPNTVLVLSEKFASGKAFPEMGIVAIGEEFVQFPDQNIPTFLLAHERTHLHIASEMRDVIQEKHGDIYRFLHERIIPDWLAGKIEFTHNDPYITEKGWSGLYKMGAWSGPSDVELPSAVEAVDNYFTLLHKGLLHEMTTPKGERIIIHDSPMFRGWEENTLSKPDRNITDMYEEDPARFTRLLLTGFKTADYLSFNYRNVLGRRSGVDLWIAEEGFANFVGSQLVGVSLDDVNQAARQDSNKIAMGKRMADKGVSATDALSGVRSYEGLVAFAKR